MAQDDPRALSAVHVFSVWLVQDRPVSIRTASLWLRPELVETLSCPVAWTRRRNRIASLSEPESGVTLAQETALVTQAVTLGRETFALFPCFLAECFFPVVLGTNNLPCPGKWFCQCRKLRLFLCVCKNVAVALFHSLKNLSPEIRRECWSHQKYKHQ